MSNHNSVPIEDQAGVAITPFDFQGHTVRVIATDPDNPLWVARDVATALGYKDPTNAIKAHCRGVANHHPIVDRLGRTQQARVIGEPDLYRLIVGSDLETAQEFERVVFEEILPSIRKRGGYLTPEATEAALTDPDFIIRLATNLKEERAHRAALEEQARQDAPKVEHYDRFLSEDSDTLTITDWGAQFGLTRPETFALLRRHKVIYHKPITREFSKKAGMQVDRLEHRPYSQHRHFFDLRQQVKAPRYHNGQVRQTLYVHITKSLELARIVGLEPQQGELEYA